MISENQELVKANDRIVIIENKISFRPKGKSSKWTEELIKAKAIRNTILFNINRKKMVEDNKKTEAFLKDYDEREKVRKEHERVLALFEEYKENTITKPELKLTQKPDFTEVGAVWKKERNYQGRLKEAQKAFDMAKLRAENSSPVGKSGRTAQLQKARNELALVLKSVEKEDGNVEFYELRAERDWNETVLAEMEAHRKDMKAYFVKTEADLALFEKHGLIKTKT